MVCESACVRVRVHEKREREQTISRVTISRAIVKNIVMYQSVSICMVLLVLLRRAGADPCISCSSSLLPPPSAPFLRRIDDGE